MKDKTKDMATIKTIDEKIAGFADAKEVEALKGLVEAKPDEAARNKNERCCK